MAIIWHLVHPRATPEMLGYVPDFLNENDPRPAREQFNAHQPGGWHPLAGFRFRNDGKEMVYGGATAPDNPARVLIAETKLRDETIRFYNGAWVAIIQPDGSFEVACLD